MMPDTRWNDGAFYHPNGEMAWGRRDGLWYPEKQPVSDSGELFLEQSFAPLDGSIRTRIWKNFGEVEGFEVLIWMDPFHAGYAFPLIWRTENQTPRHFMRDIIVRIETGYPGEVLSV
jgi:hypothetical protein